MFCSKCGKENSDSNMFCNGCGVIMKASSDDVQRERKVPLMEAISFTENPNREQTTINMHQKMGWSLKSSQEINNSTTHIHGQSYNGSGYVNSYIVKEHYVKLTFERDKNMRNYNILKQKYDEFMMLAKEIQSLEASVHIRKGKFYFLCCIPSIIIVLLSIIISANSFLGGLIIIPMIIFALTMVVPVMLIANKVVEVKVRKTVEPKIYEKYRQMADIADEAERYL